jgi:RNA 2',3'-cyclic 3'-phosphodiesterase
MGGRFGKYGDRKRREALQRGRREKSRLERIDLGLLRNRTERSPGLAGPQGPPAVKTFKTAVVVIPPKHLWEPIQALRRQYDRRYRRWMPHITLLYPFRPAAAFEQLTPHLARVCRKVAPFEIRLARFDRFGGPRKTNALFLTPEPAEKLKVLQKGLLGAVPDCDDASRFAGGFTPHLSVGQVSRQQARSLCDRWQADWRPLVFRVTQVSLIRRNDPPDDVFHVGLVLPLGAE